ncbi:alpha/beta hydrolase fold domain-containing protein [Hymenobacter cellulosilyticus]|uniref:Alpha/beta hydrolase n=1 Tax=Hymenobacter cellulosilyticus TaxID=2932248 RepID=A0A8T9Q403_9BACT|nr:alpha/beta hydrolase [Hymenobacter cellulosilyticus]UOQ71692.1 alpha/beta hydrolase [Hymenobacter cellulosilyticus]
MLLKQFLTAATAPLARRQPSIAAMRLSLEIGSLFQFLPWGVHFDCFSLEGMDAEWIKPEKADPRRVLLYLHGGGYVLGSLNTHRGVVGALAQRCEMHALTINYRKAPDFPFPAALDDALLAYRWLLKQGYPAQNIIVAGDSAGGGLALALLLALRDQKEPLPAAAIGLSPWTDLELPTGTIRRVADEELQLLEALAIRGWGGLYATDVPLTAPLVSPVQADLHDLPPLLLQTSDAEVLYDDVLQFAAKARCAGVPVTLQAFAGLVHWWHLFWRFLPEARTALDQAAAFTKGIWAAQAAAAQVVKTMRHSARKPGPELRPGPGFKLGLGFRSWLTPKQEGNP